MKKLFAFAAVTCALLVGLNGCNRTTSNPGKGGQQFTATVKEDHTIKQGDTDEVSIAVNRDNFRDEVTVKFENLPKGVTVTDANAKIAAEDKTGTFTLKAAPDAPVVENHAAQVKLRGSGGAETTQNLKITVRAKE